MSSTTPESEVHGLAAVTAAAQRRRTAQDGLDDAVRALHDTIRAAHANRWRIQQIANAAGMHRTTIHDILRSQNAAHTPRTESSPS